MTQMTDSILFSDGCWSDDLVAALNAEVTSGKTAIQIWNACTVLIEDAGECWETCPREWMLCILDARGTRGFNRLAKHFGYMPKGLEAIAPIDWEEV